MKPNYGIDAPGLVRTFFSIAVVAVALLSLMLATRWAPGLPGTVLRLLLAVAGAYTLGMGCFMVAYSRHVKTVDRERLLDMLDFSEIQRVLDVGCGRGLMMIGAAKRLPRGKAVGIDLWLEEDQSGNRPEAALKNADIEGVVDRVEVQTADMRKLPFADGGFDAVVSHWAFHNIEDRGGRNTACKEAYRVLRAGGALVLADIQNHDEYAGDLRRIGFVDVECVGESWKTDLYALISLGSFKPLALYGRKPYTQKP